MPRMAVGWNVVAQCRHQNPCSSSVPHGRVDQHDVALAVLLAVGQMVLAPADQRHERGGEGHAGGVSRYS